MDIPENEGENSFLYRLGTVLSRIEDLSHILVWSTTNTDNMRISSQIDDNNTMKISFIELPRLKIKFQPRQDNDGNIRLYLLNYAGWFVSEFDKENPLPGIKFLDKLLIGI